MKISTINSHNISINVSKIQVDALDGSLRLKKEVTTLDWQSIRSRSNHYLKAGNKALRELYTVTDKLRQSDNTLAKAKTGYKTKKAIKSNELLLTNAIVFLLQSEIELQKEAVKEKEIVKNSGEIVSIAKHVMSKTNNLLDNFQIQLYSLILQKSSQQEIAKKCFEFSNFIEGYIPELARYQVQFMKVFDYYREQGIKSNINKLGFILTQINQLTRECIGSFTASHVLMSAIMGINLKKMSILLRKSILCHMISIFLTVRTSNWIKYQTLKRVSS